MKSSTSMAIETYDVEKVKEHARHHSYYTPPLFVVKPIFMWYTRPNGLVTTAISYSFVPSSIANNVTFVI